jgi:hypothetical protein
MSHNCMGLRGLLQGLLYLHFTIFRFIANIVRTSCSLECLGSKTASILCVCACAPYVVTLHKAKFHNTYMKIDWSATSVLWHQFLFRDSLLHLLPDHATPITFPNCVMMAKKIAPRSFAFVCCCYTITMILYNLATYQRSVKGRGTWRPERATDWSFCFFNYWK